MLVTDRRKPGHADRASWGPPLPFVAQDEAPPDVEVPIEAETLVEGAAADDVLAPEREEISLDGVDVTRRRILERAQVG